MPVTEIAVLVLQDPYTNNSPETVKRMKPIFERMSAIAKNETFRAYREVESPKAIYIFAEWSSIDAHNQAWAPDEGKAVIADVMAFTQPSAMIHINGPMSALPLDAPLVTIGRWPTTKEKKKEFEEFAGAMAPLVAKHAAPYGTAGGWRLDPDETQGVKGEECIQVTGWPSEEAHQGFKASSDWTDSAKETYATFTDGEVKHLHRIALV